MCRLLGYLGAPISLEKLLYQPEHSLIVQSYQPKEMTAGLLNADGFGVGWYDERRGQEPFLSKTILPIWSDINLPYLSRYAESGCFLGYVRSATPPLAVDLTNCQPFSHQQLLFIHNGFINHFRTSLYRPIRNLLSDESYQFIHGTTDSEHIFALLLNFLQQSPRLSLAEALKATLLTLTHLAKAQHTYFSANIIVSDGQHLVASRYANRQPIPSLYWLGSTGELAPGVIVASEPLFDGPWQACPPHSLLQINHAGQVEMTTLDLGAPDPRYSEFQSGPLTSPRN